jgi:Yip1 domain
MAANNIVARAKSILLTPRSEWPAIAAEPETVAGLYSGYIIILAAIPAIVRFLSYSLIGVSVPFLGSYRVSIAAGLTTAIISYVLSLVGIYVLALIVDALAPTFGGEKNQIQALKVVAYSYTASWIASLIGIIPALGLIAALAGAIYGIYLLNMGLPFTMKCPQDKTVAYTAVTILVAIVVGFVLSLAVNSVGRYSYGFGPPPVSYRVPGRSDGPGTFASGSAGAALQAWAKNVEKASKQLDAAQKSGDASAQANAVGQMLGAAAGSGGKVESLAPERIRSFVPDSLVGLKRTQLTSERNAAMGMQISKATAVYSDGASHNLNLEITDAGALQGLIGFANGWAGVEQDKETQAGYEKTYKSDGQLVHEKWDNQSHYGEYGLIVGDRFSVTVSGNAPNIDELRRAVGDVNLAGLAALKQEGVQAN